MAQDIKEILARVRRIEITAQRLVNEQLSGRYHSVFKGRGMAFDEVRPYCPGDEVRLIDWNVTARTGEVYVKRFVEERELTVMIVADASASMDFGLCAAEYRRFSAIERAEDTKRELAAQVAAAIALAAQMNNDRVGLITFGAEVEKFIPPKKGRQHALRVIREVLAMRAKGAPSDLSKALAYLNRVQKRRAAVFIVSDFEVPSFEAALRVTARRHDVHAFLVRDPVEQGERLPTGCVLAFQDAETGRLVVAAATKAFRSRLQAVAQAREEAVIQVLNRLKVPWAKFTTDSAYDRILTRHFARLRGKAI